VRELKKGQIKQEGMEKGQVKQEGMEQREFQTDEVVDPVQTIREGTRNYAEKFDYRDTDKSLPEKAGEQVANAAGTLKNMVKEGWNMATKAAGFGANEERATTEEPGQEQRLGDMAGVDRAATRLKDDVKDARDQIAARGEDTKEGWNRDSASRTARSIKDDAKGAYQSWEQPRMDTVVQRTR